MFELDEQERKNGTVRDLVAPYPLRARDQARQRSRQRDAARPRPHGHRIDEYGNTAGLVTLEDLVEEVFGEIRDEHEPAMDVTEEAHGQYVVSGNFGLDRLEELLEFHPAEEPESTTVGGLVTEWLGRVPQAGEACRAAGHSDRSARQ